jgi:hypothetical protein
MEKTKSLEELVCSRKPASTDTEASRKREERREEW